MYTFRKSESLVENIMPVSITETTTNLPRGNKEVAQIVPTGSNVEPAHHGKYTLSTKYLCDYIWKQSVKFHRMSADYESLI